MNVVRLFSRAHVALLGLGIGRRFRGNRVVVLTTRGRRSGKLRRTPLLAYEDGEQLVLVASFGGSPTHPHWFGNLTATFDPRGSNTRPAAWEFPSPLARPAGLEDSPRGVGVFHRRERASLDTHELPELNFI